MQQVTSLLLHPSSELEQNSERSETSLYLLHLRLDSTESNCARDFKNDDGLNFLPCGDYADYSRSNCEDAIFRNVRCCFKKVKGAASCWVELSKVEAELKKSQYTIGKWAEAAGIPSIPNAGELKNKAIEASSNLLESDQVRNRKISADFDAAFDCSYTQLCILLLAQIERMTALEETLIFQDFVIYVFASGESSKYISTCRPR